MVAAQNIERDGGRQGRVRGAIAVDTRPTRARRAASTQRQSDPQRDAAKPAKALPNEKPDAKTV
jgi:hypothetical protein